MKRLGATKTLFTHLVAAHLALSNLHLEALPVPGAFYQLVIPGHYARDELPQDVEGTWLGLAWSPLGTSLSEVDVRLRPAQNPRIAGDPQKPGAIVETDPPGVILLLRGEGLKPGVPAFTSVAGEVQLNPGDSIDVGPVGRWRFVTSGARQERRSDVDMEVFDLRVTDTLSGVTESLGEWMTASGPRLHWAGDLNGDDRLDLVILHSVETGERIWSLFLSGPGRGLSVAAEFHLPGC